MRDIFSKWYVPRSEYARMMEVHAMEIADLRAQVQQLQAALSVESAFCIDEFEVVAFDDLPLPTDTPSNVVNVDFRRRR